MSSVAMPSDRRAGVCGRTALGVGLVAAMVASAPGRPSAAAAPGNPEYGLKAAFILNLTMFVDWPGGALPAEDTPLQIAILGRDAGEQIRRALANASSRGRPIRVSVYQNVQDLASCHVLFVAVEAVLEQPRALRWAAGRPVLTVTESPTTTRPQAVIALLAEGTRLAFGVDLDAAEANMLRPAARLLSLAKQVRGERLSR